jgi:hypothetical protein
MKVILNKKVYRWVKLFMDNMKKKYVKKTKKNLYCFQKIEVFNRLTRSVHLSK